MTIISLILLAVSIWVDVVVYNSADIICLQSFSPNSIIIFTTEFMKFLLNVIWVVFGGLMIALEYVIAGIGMIITIIGIPFGLQAFKLAIVALWPFGAQIQESTPPLNGCLSVIMNVIWWFVGGFAIALTHLGWGLLFCITIVGIPWGMEHFKLARLALWPFGRTVS